MQDKRVLRSNESHEQGNQGKQSNMRPGVELSELVEIRINRRNALKFMSGLVPALSIGAGLGRNARAAPIGLSFAPVEHGYDDNLHVPEGYLAKSLLRWGDPIMANAQAFNPNRQTGEAQGRQFGYNCDFVKFMPLPAGSAASDHGLLFVNHEYTLPHLMFAGFVDGADAIEKASAEMAAIEMAAHGASIIEVRKTAGEWNVVIDSPFNRRLTASTPMEISGPAAGHGRLATAADPTGRLVLGTLNNCGGGSTPWGTILSAEENFNGYFVGNVQATEESQNHARYGIKGAPAYAWGKFEPRFDVSMEPNEPNRFGWVVEIDPYDPAKPAVKRTALGRFKHEAATTVINHDGRIAVYSGDDERFEYIYKYVSAGAFDPDAGAANSRLLDDGVLYVARFAANGVVEWLPLVWGTEPLTPRNGFHSQADVLIETRRAADLLGATQMDRPEDIETSPENGKVYVVLTKNDKRKPEEVDAVNPRPGNKWGQIVELAPPVKDGVVDHGASRFAWNVFIQAGDPSIAGEGAIYGGDVGDSGWFCNPDNIAFDPEGRLWIATDGFTDFGVHDGLWATQTEGAERAITRHFLGCPRGAELCGPEFTPDGRTLFVAIQHPGEEEGSTFDRPSTRWPDFDSDMPPRPAIVAITRKDGGAIGA